LFDLPFLHVFILKDFLYFTAIKIVFELFYTQSNWLLGREVEGTAQWEGVLLLIVATKWQLDVGYLESPIVAGDGEAEHPHLGVVRESDGSL
jgi:hypothetical protein